MKQFITEQTEDLKQFITELLPDYNNGEPSDMLKVLLAYDMVVRTNFILWLMLTNGNVQTAEAKQVLEENIKCQIEENHPQLLLNVIVPALQFLAVFYSIRDQYEDVDAVMLPIVAREIRFLTQKAASVKGLFLMALWENSSLVFIPWLNEISFHRLAISDGKYFLIHRETDINATAFIEAASVEFESVIEKLAKSDLKRRRYYRGQMSIELGEITESLKRVFSAIFSFAKVPQTV
ncbi:MAG TPA: hypothetical protein VG621_03320 [Candidatus Paceibacterota bacterium]|nr:hypothetical protein [Candidatus Paceibacterota bacterium]